MKCGRVDRELSPVMKELLKTERDYIGALNYVVDNYIPEILSDGVPQPLRGKKNVVFGNVQNICKFHTDLFLREIEACVHSPYQLGACFLRHVQLSHSLLYLVSNDSHVYRTVGLYGMKWGHQDIGPNQRRAACRKGHSILPEKGATFPSQKYSNEE